MTATASAVPIERDATDPATDILVTELRAVITDLRRNQEDLRQERDKWQKAHEREQAAHAATQRLLLPPPATPPEHDATAPATATEHGATPSEQSATANETRRNGWRWWRLAAAPEPAGRRRREPR